CVQTRARDRAGGGPTQVFIHHVHLAPGHCCSPALHRVLQPLAFEIVSHLVGGRLAHIQNRLPATCCGRILSLITLYAAFCTYDAYQCGYRTTGQIVSAVAFAEGAMWTR